MRQKSQILISCDNYFNILLFFNYYDILIYKAESLYVRRKTFKR